MLALGYRQQGKVSQVPKEDKWASQTKHYATGSLLTTVLTVSLRPGCSTCDRAAVVVLSGDLLEMQNLQLYPSCTEFQVYILIILGDFVFLINKGPFFFSNSRVVWTDGGCIFLYRKLIGIWLRYWVPMAQTLDIF